jgi:hypothetical protein
MLIWQEELITRKISHCLTMTDFMIIFQLTMTFHHHHPSSILSPAPLVCQWPAIDSFKGGISKKYTKCVFSILVKNKFKNYFFSNSTPYIFVLNNNKSLWPTNKYKKTNKGLHRAQQVTIEAGWLGKVEQTYIKNKCGTGQVNFWTQ